MVESHTDGLRPPAIHVRICEADTDVTFRFAKLPDLRPQLIIFDFMLCTCASHESVIPPAHEVLQSALLLCFMFANGMATVHIMHGQDKKRFCMLVLSVAIAPCLKAVLLAGSQIRVEAFWQRISAKCGSMATQQSTTKTAAHSPAHQTQTPLGGLSLGPSTGWGVLGLGCPCLDCMLNTLVSPWSQILNGSNHGFLDFPTSLLILIETMHTCTAIRLLP